MLRDKNGQSIVKDGQCEPNKSEFSGKMDDNARNQTWHFQFNSIFTTHIFTTDIFLTFGLIFVICKDSMLLLDSISYLLQSCKMIFYNAFHNRWDTFYYLMSMLGSRIPRKKMFFQVWDAKKSEFLETKLFIDFCIHNFSLSYFSLCPLSVLLFIQSVDLLRWVLKVHFA